MPSDLEKIGHQLSINHIAEAKQLVREQLLQARATSADLSTPFPPEGRQGEVYRNLHSYTFDFVDQIRPVSDQVEDLWNAEVYRVEYGPVDREVNCATLLDKWEDQTVEQTETVTDSLYGEQTTTHVRHMYLPPKGCAALYNQVKKMLNALNIYLQVEASRARQVPDELPKHIQLSGDGESYEVRDPTGTEGEADD